MKFQNFLKSFMTITLLASGIAHAEPERPGRFPGPPMNPGHGGGNRPPGPVRPTPDDNECRELRYNDPRCNHRGGDGRDDRWGRGGRDDRWNHGGRDDYRNPRFPPHRPPYRPPYQPPYQPPYRPPYNPPPVYNPPPSRSESSIVLNAISRSSGGEWHRVSLYNPLRLDYIELRVLSASLQIHEAYVLTSTGNRYPVREFSRTGTFTSRRVSEILNLREDIVAIDLRAESMGGYANLQVTVVSSDGSTSLLTNRY